MVRDSEPHSILERKSICQCLPVVPTRSQKGAAMASHHQAWKPKIGAIPKAKYSKHIHAIPCPLPKENVKKMQPCATMCNVCKNVLTELARIPLLVLPGFWFFRAWHPGRSTCTECCLVLQVLPLAKALLNYLNKCQISCLISQTFTKVVIGQPTAGEETGNMQNFERLPGC